jgi:hypothetical protein
MASLIHRISHLVYPVCVIVSRHPTSWCSLFNSVSNAVYAYSPHPPKCQVPTYTSKQLVVVLRDKTPEVWTLVDFAAGALVFAPDTNEIKDSVQSLTNRVDCSRAFRFGAGGGH